MSKAKYIKTEDNDIIVFGEQLMHSDFKHMNPVSAGFIYFGIDNYGSPTCSCHGESISLRLASDEEEDTFLAQSQLGFKYY
jgi:hypothetical protein